MKKTIKAQDSSSKGFLNSQLDEEDDPIDFGTIKNDTEGPLNRPKSDIFSITQIKQNRSPGPIPMKFNTPKLGRIHSAGSVRSLRRTNSFSQLFTIKSTKDPFEEYSKTYSVMSANERGSELQEIKKRLRNYQVLMYMIAINAACATYTRNMIVFYLKSVLGLTAASSGAVTALIGMSWNFKPVWGFLSDSFSIGGYRFKAHVLTMCVAASASVLYFVWQPEPSQAEFTACLFVFNLANSYNDSIAEGISAMVTKYQKKVEILENLQKEPEDFAGGEDGGDSRNSGIHQKKENSMKAIGIFNAIRSFLSSFMMLLGGYFITVKGLDFSGMVLAISPTILFFAVLIAFEDEKQEKCFGGCQSFKKGLTLTLKALLVPEVLFPFVYMIIVLAAPTTYFEFSYVLLGPGEYDFEQYNLVTFYAQILLSIVLLGMVKVADYVEFNYIMLMSQIFMSVSVIGGGLSLYAQDVPQWLFSVYWVLIVACQTIGQNLFFVAIAGRISKYLPEGYECTGVTLVISASNSAINVNNYLAKPFLDYFQVKDGYFGRLQAPQVITSLVQIFYVVSAPLLLFMK